MYPVMDSAFELKVRPVAGPIVVVTAAPPEVVDSVKVVPPLVTVM